MRRGEARPGRGLLPLVALALSALALACGGDGVDEAERQAVLEQRYGRRAGTDTGSGPDAESVPTAGPAGPVDPADSGPRPAAPTSGPGAETGSDADASGRTATRPDAERARREAEAPERPAGAAPGEPPGPEVEPLLAAAERAYAGLSSLRAEFRQRMEVPLLERSREGAGIWYQKGRSRFRMDFTDPPDDEVVADGTYVWIYHPSDQPGQVIRSELDTETGDSGSPDLLARILSRARTAYASRYEGRETVSGVETHVVELTPTGRSPYRRVRVWIGVDDRLVRRFRIVEQNESVRTVTLSDLEPNVALPDSLFRFTPPPGVDVFAG